MVILLGIPVRMITRLHKRHGKNGNKAKNQYEVKDPTKTTSPVKEKNTAKETRTAKETNTNQSPNNNNPNGANNSQPPPTTSGNDPDGTNNPQPQPTSSNGNDPNNPQSQSPQPQPTTSDINNNNVSTMTGLNPSSYQISPTPTFMPADQVPFEQNRPKISVAGSVIISMIFFGIVALVVFVVYRKRSDLRKGAVRLYDDIQDENEDDIVPRFLSMSNIKSLRIPSMPPRVQLTRLSSATILLPFKDNLSSSSNDLNSNYNNNNHNNYNNGYLSPYDNLSSPNSTLSSGKFTISDYNEYSSQKTDSVSSYLSSQESYTSLESSFPIPPQRDANNSTPTSVTFGEIYNLKIV